MPANILEDLTARGLVNQATPGLADHLKQARTLYCGFDPTADSLHIGSLVPLLTLRRFQQAGHTPIVLVGGATGMIGDPSFKAQERKLNDTATIKNWVAKLERQTAPFFKGGTPPAKMADNYDWTHGVDILDFLRDVGKHFSVNNLIAKEAIAARLKREDTGISFTEFSYPLLQAFDFQQLYQRHTCTIQIGGSDQWGNMTAGTELIRKTIPGGEAHVLTLPLVTKADGTKFGKTETGTIWLDAAKTSPYAFYQFWLNTADADLEKFMLYFSFQPVNIIKQNIQDCRAGLSFGNTTLIPMLSKPGEFQTIYQPAPEFKFEINELKREFAKEITILIHGQKAFESALRITQSLFGTGVKEMFLEGKNKLDSLSKTDYAQLALDGLPTAKSGTTTLLEALTATGLAQSNREARDFLKGNAVQLNGQPVTDEKLELTKANAQYGKYHLLKRGKKNFALLVLE
jgi:tyrosyl-tRNA synthetase